MNQRIYKYMFDVNDIVTFEMPKGATVLHVQCQRGTPCLWALVDLDAPVDRREFRIVGTGHPFPDANKFEHVGTFLNEPFVWHVFERITLAAALAKVL